MIEIRGEQNGDEAAIHDLLVAGFGATVEADLVERLREHGAVVVALVAVADERVVGHIAFSRLWVENGQRLTPAIALAPLAVHADFREAGIGGRLVEEGHRLLVELRERLSIVLGEPTFYRRFGYRREDAAGYESAYHGRHLLALRFNDIAPRQGKLRYDPAFDGL